MKKKILIAALLTSVIGVVVWLLVQSYQTLQHKKEIETKMQRLPTVSLRGLDSTAIMLNESARPTIIFYFDPHCEHCQNEAAALKKQARAFAKVRLLWVSVAQLVDLSAFEKEFELEKTIPSLTIAQISPQDADKQFGFRTVPTILIYDSQQKLVKRYTGETKIEAIAKHIKGV